jgi:hypothetical protein
MQKQTFKGMDIPPGKDYNKKSVCFWQKRKLKFGRRI